MGFFGNYRALHELQINGKNPDEDDEQNKTTDEPEDPTPAEPEDPTTEEPPADTPPADEPPAEDPAPTPDEPDDPDTGEIPEDAPEDYEIPDDAEPPVEGEEPAPTADEPDDPDTGEIPEDTATDDPDAMPDEPTDPVDTGDTDTPPADDGGTDDPDAMPDEPADPTDTGGNAGGDPDMPDDGGDGTMPDEGGEGDDGTLPADGGTDGGEATSGSQIANDLKSLEDEIFGDLSDQQKDIRDNELKNSYITLYGVIDDAEKRINNIIKNENTGRVLEFITRKMNELKSLIHHNLTVVYSTRTYVENQTALQECIAIMNIICTMLDSIAKEDLKQMEEGE